MPAESGQAMLGDTWGLKRRWRDREVDEPAETLMAAEHHVWVSSLQRPSWLQAPCLGKPDQKKAVQAGSEPSLPASDLPSDTSGCPFSGNPNDIQRPA